MKFIQTWPITSEHVCKKTGFEFSMYGNMRFIEGIRDLYKLDLSSEREGQGREGREGREGKGRQDKTRQDQDKTGIG
jgi:hypothetical protein